MKKLLALIIAVVSIACFSLTGCSGVKPLKDVSGNVESGNGTFLVEKGAYLYFVNGLGDFTVTNKMGDIEKGALMRVKKADLASLSTATVETVIPKLVTTSSATDGFYMYGDCVYFATAFDGKDKSGKVRSDYTDFVRFDLIKAKATRITYETKKVTDYTFVQTGNAVTLAYVTSEKVDEVETKGFKAYNALNGELLVEEESVASILMPSSLEEPYLGNYVFYTRKAHSEALDQDEGYEELYRYAMGDSESELILSGVGSAALGRDNNADIPSAKLFKKDGVLESITGLTFTLIQNTGKVLVFKTTDTDTNYSTSKYYYVELENQGAKVADFTGRICLGVSSTWLDTAITASSYYKSATEIYYVESSTYVDHLVKFDYSANDPYNHGRTILTDSVKGMNIAFVEDGKMYFIESSAGNYYVLDYATAGAKAYKVNGSALKTATDWFKPRVIDNYFIGSYSASIFNSYLYVIDMTGIGGDEYEEAINAYASLDRDKVIALRGTLLGKMTEADQTSYQETLDKDYPLKDEE
ncbi:MAG: hypothetical protein IKL82_02975 [Clostridia bacterium]|nr:hypothetical protein [Clostridia bacterium]